MLIDIAQAVGGYLHDVFVGNADWGILVGYIAQALFAMRFVVQWIASERAGRSVVPTAFWGRACDAERIAVICAPATTLAGWAHPKTI